MPIFSGILPSMDFIPDKAYTIILQAMAPVVVGFALNRFFPDDSFVLLTGFVLVAVIPLGYFVILTSAIWNEERENDAVPIRSEPLKYKDMSVPEYAVDTLKVTMDVERNFAARLLKDFRSGADIKLTEKYLYDSGLWRQVGGTTLPQLRNFLQDWESRNLLVKRGGRTSTREVRSWKRIEDITK